ncbi:uncharacterized protein LOC129939988 [Eupeodes corollae]|uniref:uncharacterized protein LOC129939988 n=1 Tax=Eupeodes corollae TaxID=290404 RepID=UPI002492C6A4|nr:uncharacterized protein LOC129939988 [Eupeodes corollae]XP_055904178.1 uncharacterized protein LOC129939988 [Eupeodes corollae]XP_055904179.1 uncharacterized protein LOC129939988 [Eupeodes corollae]
MASTSKNIALSASSDDEDYDVSIDTENLYLLQPKDGELENEVVEKCISEVKESEGIITKELEYVAFKRKFHPNVINRFNYTQYNYKNPIKFAVIGNSYGVCVSNLEDFSTKTVMESLNSLEAKHRVSVLMPTAWHAETKKLMTSVIEGFITDLRKLSTKSKDLENNLKKHNIKFSDMPDILNKLKTRYITGSSIRQGKTSPGVFGVRLFTSQTPPAKILSPVLELKGDSIVESKWEKLSTPNYMYSVIIVKFTGFKITKSGLSLDLAVDCLLYKKMQRSHEKPESSYLRASVVVKRRATESDDDSSDEHCHQIKKI